MRAHCAVVPVHLFTADTNNPRADSTQACNHTWGRIGDLTGGCLLVATTMALSQFFILSPRGDTIISKDFRGDSPAGAAEDFFRKVKFWEHGDAPPVFKIDTVTYIFVRKNGLLFACNTRFNVSPSMYLELINRLIKVRASQAKHAHVLPYWHLKSPRRASLS
jgi:hypothetical protein